jgi:hypothetical protein
MFHDKKWNGAPELGQDLWGLPRPKDWCSDSARSVVKPGNVNWNRCPVCSDYFGVKVLLFAQASLDHNPPVYTPCNHWDDRRVPQCPAFLCWDAELKNFAPGLPWNMSLLISMSQVARITGVTTGTQLLNTVFKFSP